MYTAKTYCISSAKPSTANVFVTHIRFTGYLKTIQMAALATRRMMAQLR